jgi:hypothetical protein
VQAIILLSKPCFLGFAGLKFCGLATLANAGALGIELGGTALEFGLNLRVNDLPAAFPGHDLTELEDEDQRHDHVAVVSTQAGNNPVLRQRHLLPPYHAIRDDAAAIPI